ncbi:hypothetical protein B0H10DRAFT_1967384 [Mycena sp. CBHHK59/15]|nr:hypothetical protein B0H10DRAFT_1967384 [Mycena sp. CBHHK59/15]
MDLENFDIDGLDQPVVNNGGAVSSQKALEVVDQQWFTSATRRARWMDLLGDYAGVELFLISGSHCESLFERVLDDPLLAIGRAEDLSFQILHAYYILETTLLEFINRRANFEIVFWQANYHSTVHTGTSSFVVASRHLARSLLFEHLLKLDVVVHTFEDLDDPSWLRFQVDRKPMFVLINDGGVVDQGGFQAERTFLQRIFLFRIMNGGMAIALLNGAEFRDSKILSFVYHEAHRRNQQPLSENLIHAVDEAKISLDAEMIRHNPTCLSSLLSAERRCMEQNLRMIDFSRRAVQKLDCGWSLELLYLFLLHAAILPDLSLPERAQSCSSLNLDLTVLLSRVFLPEVFFLASPLPFDIDGRVFASLISAVITHRSQTLPDIVGPAAYEKVQAIWIHTSLPNPDLSALCARHVASPANKPPTPAQALLVYKLLPFNHRMFNSILFPDTVEDKEEDAPRESAARLDFGIPFSDTRHWHNSKSILPSHLGGEDQQKVLTERQRQRQNRKNQRFMTTLQKNAATLTGALGASLQQIIIVSAKKQSNDSRVSKGRAEAEVHRLGKKGKPVVLTSAQKLRERIKQEKTASQDDSSYKWWRNELDSMARIESTNRQADKLKSLFRNKRSEESMIGLEMRLYSLDLTLIQWVEDPARESQLVRDEFSLSVMKQVKAICDRKTLTPTAAGVIKAVLVSLGFAAYVPYFHSDSIDIPDRPLTFTPTKLLKAKAPQHKFMATKEHPVEWQLRLFGEYMDRSMDSALDSRVTFKPDAGKERFWIASTRTFLFWSSVSFIETPTSAGKTFISYYSMEKILRDSDDGVLVYVAPTKALVTQIAAEIYARFKKNLDGKSLWAIHTRDYRINDPLKCQILVTVPEILATLLLSPPLARVWTPRMKSIILDEIHSIGQQEGGAVWEQIILMAPCPIIGLSATIGSPQDFSRWLQSVQEAHGFQYRLVQHPHRYSHLRKFFYALDETPRPEFKGLVLHQDTQRSRFLHPISLLSFGARSLPEDLALEASDCLTLYQALEKHAPGCEHLHPQTFFSSNPAGATLLVQKDIIRYEHALKEKLVSLMEVREENDSATTLSNIIRDLQDPKLSSMKHLNTPPSRESCKENLIFLLSDLHVKGELPAILFSFDRTDCEVLAQELLSTLKISENKWRNGSPTWKEKVKRWEQWMKGAKERERTMERIARQRKQDDDMPQDREQTYSWESSFNPDHPSSESSFAGTASFSTSELTEHIDDLRWSNTPDWALEALMRGVGVHHAGMNKIYRSLVER